MDGEAADRGLGTWLVAERVCGVVFPFGAAERPRRRRANCLRSPVEFESPFDAYSFLKESKVWQPGTAAADAVHTVVGPGLKIESRARFPGAPRSDSSTGFGRDADVRADVRR